MFTLILVVYLFTALYVHVCMPISPCDIVLPAMHCLLCSWAWNSAISVSPFASYVARLVAWLVCGFAGYLPAMDGWVGWLVAHLANWVMLLLSLSPSLPHTMWPTLGCFPSGWSEL